jgi:hypothetical protein
VRSAALADDVDTALAGAGVPADQLGAYRVALAKLVDAEVLVATR